MSSLFHYIYQSLLLCFLSICWSLTAADFTTISAGKLGLLKSQKAKKLPHGEAVGASDLGFDGEWKRTNGDAVVMGTHKGDAEEKQSLVMAIDGLGERDRAATRIVISAIKKHIPVISALAEAHHEIKNRLHPSSERLSGACVSLVLINNQSGPCLLDKILPTAFYYERVLDKEDGVFPWRKGVLYHPCGDIRLRVIKVKELSKSAEFYAHIVQVGDSRVYIYDPDSEEAIFDSSSPPDEWQKIESMKVFSTIEDQYR